MVIYMTDNVITLEFFTETELNVEPVIGSDNTTVPLGYTPQDALSFVNQVIKSINDGSDGKKVFYIKNSSLFFCDNVGSHVSCVPHSVHLLKEFLNNNDNDFLLIIVAEKLEFFPTALYTDNPDVEIIHIEMPDMDIREEFLRTFELKPEVLNQYIKITNNRSLKEIQKIFDIADNENLDLDKPKEVISYYDFGEKESPWTKLKDDDIRKIDVTLKKRVFGQDEAIDYAKKILIRAKLGLSTAHQHGYSTRPIGIFFFVGPTGVGKTELAKAITEAVFGDENKFKRFDMSEYKEETSINKLIGTSPGYVGFEQGGELTNWMRENPFSVLLFDEIEKGNPLIWDTFLQILEDGRLTDNKGKTVYFNESIIIFTSNIGNQEAREKGNNDEMKIIYKNAVKEYFSSKLGRVEILNRIGNNIIVFNSIENKDIYRDIVKSRLNLVIKNIEEKLSCRVKFKNKETELDVISFIVKKLTNSNEKFGGRAVINFLETYFINEFGSFYMESRKDVVFISVVDNKISFS